MASGDGDGDKMSSQQQLTLEELNNNGNTTSSNGQDVDVKVVKQPKDSNDLTVSPTGETDNDALVLEGTEESTAGGTTCELIDDLDQQQQDEDFCTFPDLPVIKIMKFTDLQTLLSSRLVCTQWNQIVQDTSKLMKKITFYVWNLQEFLDLPIVKKGKIKSIIVKTCSPTELLHSFVDAISSSVHKITFIILNSEEQLKLSPMLKLVLEKCVNLYELRFDQCFGGDGLGLSKSVIEEVKIVTQQKINLLSVNVHGLKLSDVAGLSALLSKLPVLKEIEFVGNSDKDDCRIIYPAIINTLNAFLEGCDSTSLKKVSLKPIRDLRNERNFLSDSWREPFGPPLALLFAQCGKHGIRIDKMPYLDLRWLLRIDSPLFYSILDGPLRTAKADGFIRFVDNSELTNLDRFNLLNVEELEIFFLTRGHNLIQGELSWIGNLQGLQVLTLRAWGLPCNIELDAAFSTGVSSLKALTIWEDVFDSIHVLKLGQYFPNL